MAKYEKKHTPNAKFLKNVGKAIRLIRKEQGLTIEELSFKSGINHKYIQRCETGKCNPSISVVHNLAKALNVTFSEIEKRINNLI